MAMTDDTWVRNPGPAICARSAFTLTEVLIAFSVLAGAIVGASLLFSTLSRGLLFRGNVVTALELAQGKLEEVLEQNYGDMQDGRDVIGDFQRVWSVSNRSQYAWIQVDVAWIDIGDYERSMRLGRARTH